MNYFVVHKLGSFSEWASWFMMLFWCLGNLKELGEHTYIKCLGVCVWSGVLLVVRVCECLCVGMCVYFSENFTDFFISVFFDLLQDLCMSLCHNLILFPLLPLRSLTAQPAVRDEWRKWRGGGTGERLPESESWKFCLFWSLSHRIYWKLCVMVSKEESISDMNM